MPEKSTTTPYVPGGSAVAQAANEEYKKALEDMLTTLDTRKSRLFDPQLLALSKGFLAPNPSGSFFSALGNAAEEAGKSQLEQEKENREIAQARLGLAGQKVGLASQQARDLAARQWLSDMNKPGAGGVGMAAGDEEDDGGIQLFPPNPNMMTGKQYIAQQLRLNPGADLAALQKEAIEIDRKNIHTTDKAAFNLGTGKMYPVIGHGTTNIVIDGQEYPVSEGVARKFSIAQARGMNKGDWTDYLRLRDMILNGIDVSGGQPPKAGAAPAPTAAAPTAAAPTAGTPAAPAPTAAPQAPQAVTTFGTTGQRLPGTQSKQQQAVQQKGEEAYSGEEAKDVRATISSLPVNARRSAGMFASAEQIKKLLAESGDYVGIFDRQGLMPALGRVVTGGFRTGRDGSFNIAEFESAVRLLNPSLTDKDIANVGMIASKLAELEFQYAQALAKGQGAMSNNEREVIRRIGGSTSDNPETLKAKMRYIQEKAQYDLDLDQAWSDFKKKKENSGMSDLQQWRKFSNNELRDFNNRYEERLARAFGLKKAAVPSSSRGSSGLDQSRKIVQDIINQEKK